MPESKDKNAARVPRGRMRRLDIEEILGRVPAPDIEDGQYLVDILFQVGPAKGELPLCEGDLEPWERRRGIELAPWVAELLVQLSGTYMHQSHVSRAFSALCPWPKGRKMWMYVTSEKHARQLKEKPKEQPHDGSRKRHRNPPTG